MKISELIEKLKKIKEENGDLDAFFNDDYYGHCPIDEILIMNEAQDYTETIEKKFVLLN